MFQGSCISSILLGKVLLFSAESVRIIALIVVLVIAGQLFVVCHAQSHDPVLVLAIIELVGVFGLFF